jgi:ankyrin repeat protein
MHDFFDPRIEKPISIGGRPSRITAPAEQSVELHALCRDGRLYDAERWIQGDRPLQVDRTTPNKSTASALQIAIEAGNHSLVLLLLSNGYDANQDVNSPLDLALRARRFDLVTLLLEWGTDPHRVDLDDLFGTYNSELFERFRALGVDLTADHALAGAIAYHTSNKPLLGFAKRHRLTDDRFQKELDIALAHHAAEGNEKGLQLCLWAGANRHTPVPSLRFGAAQSSSEDDSDPDDACLLSSAVYEACQSGREEILKRLRPDPLRDDFEELWRVASTAGVIDVLAQHGLPANIGAIVQHHLWWSIFGDAWRRIAALRHRFEVGVRWTEASAQEIGNLRRSLLRASDSTFVDLMKLLATDDYCSSAVLRELARTPSMLGRMKKVGFIPSHDEHIRSPQLRPTRSGEVLRKFGVELPKPKRSNATSVPVPRSVRIRRSEGQAIEFDREELFERVWSKPVAIVAKECGVSGPGLKKICVRLAIPVPPRGYWAKLNAGKPVRRAKLPGLATSNAPKIL